MVQPTKLARRRMVMESADKPGTKVWNERGNRAGRLVAIYGHYAWVLWDDVTARTGGEWMPETESRVNVWVKEE